MFEPATLHLHIAPRILKTASRLSLSWTRSTCQSITVVGSSCKGNDVSQAASCRGHTVSYVLRCSAITAASRLSFEMCRSVVSALHGGLPDNKKYQEFLSHERNSDLQRCIGLEVISANLVALLIYTGATTRLRDAFRLCKITPRESWQSS